MQLQSLSMPTLTREPVIEHIQEHAHPQSAPHEHSALVMEPPRSACAISVVIPARDEAQSIERTLESLAGQRDLAGRQLPYDLYEIILLANNCQDATAAQARRLAERFAGLALHVVEITLPLAKAHVGFARRLVMDEACRRLRSQARQRGIIATTDADTVVSPTWIAATLNEIEHGADAVGGRIIVGADERQAMTPQVRKRFLRNVGYFSLANEVAARIDPRPGDPWPSHGQFFGASFAITAQAYQRVGRLPILSSGEDTALAHALRRADLTIRHSPDVRVFTSARLDGRAPAGLAALLVSWARLSPDAQHQLAPAATTVVAQATCQRALRDLWERARTDRDICPGELARLAEFMAIPESWLGPAILGAIHLGPLFEAVAEQSHWWITPDLVDVRIAIADLRSWLEPYRRPGARPPTFARHVEGLPLLQPARTARRRLAIAERPPASAASLEEIEAVPLLTPPPQVA